MEEGEIPGFRKNRRPRSPVGSRGGGYIAEFYLKKKKNPITSKILSVNNFKKNLLKSTCHTRIFLENCTFSFPFFGQKKPPTCRVVKAKIHRPGVLGSIILLYQYTPLPPAPSPGRPGTPPRV